ncbi:Actin protein 5 arp5 [Fasciolopsis buskii]|uniref:Actin protein 5 arp5 n=1 Tax=Fasciolopsis buskii TaxID=27845 RepID=A0A8E0VFC3_9TREM|nr:Actin protein 5 arp5 [Fasciolopsis buski]
MVEVFQPLTIKPDHPFPWSPGLENIPIVIDNGAFECRAGYASHEEPHLTFRNVIYRPRMAKSVLVGNDIEDVDSVRHLLKSPFLEYLLTGLDVQEHIFDHIFERLGVRSEGVAHPVIINEVLCNSSVCRMQLTELIFETYEVPKLAYYVDGLAAYYDYCCRHSKTDSGNCLIISLGYHSTHIIPSLPSPKSRQAPFQCFDFNPLLSAARRVHVGGAHVNWLLQRLLQLKYPCHSERISCGLTEYLLHTYGYITKNYREHMVKWREDDYRLSNTRVIQLPFVQPSVDELNAAADRKRAQAVRLLDIHRRRQLQQLDTVKERLQKLFTLEDMIELNRMKNSTSEEMSSPVRSELDRAGLQSEEALYEEIERCQSLESTLEEQLAANEANEAREATKATETTVATSGLANDERFMAGISQLLGSDNRLKPSSMLTGRLKRAADLLISLALPAAVQAQMIAGPAPGDTKLSEVKLSQRIRLATELEASRGSDFVSWLMSIRHRRLKVAKRRTQRQSRIDLATQIGLHGPNSLALPNNGILSDETPAKSLHASSSSSQLTGDQAANGHSGSGENKYTQRNLLAGAGESTDGGRGITERRRLQLERIRAMAAELKPTRPRGSKTRPSRSIGGRGSRAGLASTASGVVRGQGRGCRGGRGSRGGRLANIAKSTTSAVRRQPSDGEDMEIGGLDESSNPLAAADDWDEIEITGTPSPTWDIDTEENSCLTAELDVSHAPKTSAIRLDVESYTDPGDESESERDQLAVLDTLLTLYDPEASRDIGGIGLNVPLEQFYQIHVNTELPRACELFFQPSFLGNSEAGFGECLEFVLRDVRREQTQLSDSVVASWPERIFLTGSLAQLPGFAERMYAEIRPLLPYGLEGDRIEIVVSDDPRLGAWHGARRLALDDQADIYLTRQLYEECGSDYLIDHPVGNRWWHPKNS